MDVCEQAFVPGVSRDDAFVIGWFLWAEISCDQPVCIASFSRELSRIFRDVNK